MASETQAAYQGKATSASNLLFSLRAITKVTDKIYYIMAFVCGMELLLLGFFITYQVVARKLNWIMAHGRSHIPSDQDPTFESTYCFRTWVEKSERLPTGWRSSPSRSSLT